jgi:hypothetical protein
MTKMAKLEKKQKSMSKAKSKDKAVSASQPAVNSAAEVKLEDFMPPPSTNPLPALASPVSDRQPPTPKSVQSQANSHFRNSPLPIHFPQSVRHSPAHGKQHQNSGKANHDIFRSNLRDGKQVDAFEDVFKDIGNFNHPHQPTHSTTMNNFAPDEWQGFDPLATHQQQGYSNSSDAGSGVLLDGIYDASQGADDHQDVRMQGSNANTSPTNANASSSEEDSDPSKSTNDDNSGSSSTSDASSSSDGNIAEITYDQERGLAEDTNSDEDSDDNIDPALKRLKTNHSIVFGDLAPSHPNTTSVATRNPPPPELEAKYSTSSQTYRYPKIVIDTAKKLESCVPPVAMNYIKENMPLKSKQAIKKIEDSEEQGATKLLVEVMGATRWLITYLGRYRADNGNGDEAMKAQLMRIAKDRGDEADRLRREVESLRQEVTELKERNKRKRT